MPRRNSLEALIRAILPEDESNRLFRLLVIHPALLADSGPDVSRAIVAQALNSLLFNDLLARVPEARAYAEDRLLAGETILHDHGAVRTIDLEGMGDLPVGEEALMRILRPLGYEPNGLYPLERLGMTGRAYAQADYPESLPQFFVSELHPRRFSSAFQSAIARVTEVSWDPLDTTAKRSLNKLAEGQKLSFLEACEALPVMAGCFGRQHDVQALADYEILLAESAEAAWIATEGNAFNHATDRVADVEAVAQQQRKLGRPMKDRVEVSSSGRVRQTAYRATTNLRPFRLEDGSIIERPVPGSFYEFITRSIMDDAGTIRLDLGFDSSNAQGIFKMTAAAQ